jgi:plasmid stabilization system protein ParE
LKLIVAAAALADFERLHAFLARKNASVAADAVLGLDAALQRLTSFPDVGRPSGKPGIRELVVPFGRSAYVIRYAHIEDKDEVVILRVWHGREERR